MKGIKELEGNVNNQEIIDFNNNSVLPIDLLSNNTEEINEKGYEIKSKINNFMSKDIKCENFNLSFFGYPTDEDEYRMTDITLVNEEYNFLGIYCGMNKDNAVSLLSNYNFNLSENKALNHIDYSNDDTVLVYNLKNCKVAIKLQDNIISRIEVSLITKYLGNRLY